MAVFWTALLKFLGPAISQRITQALAYFMGVRAGIRKQKEAQDDADDNAILRADAARADLDFSDDVMRDDKNNRDNW